MTERYKNRQKYPFFLHFFVSATEFPLFDQNRKPASFCLQFAIFLYCAVFRKSCHVGYYPSKP